jgi:sucrose-6-phosphate hydrolase SacC (GH32 family)
MPFNQMMNFPVELTLRTTDEGIRMFAEPVKEIELLHKKAHSWKGKTLKEGGENLLKDITGDLFHIVAEFEVGDSAQFGFAIRSVPVVYDAKRQELSCKGRKASLKPEGGKVRLEILVDRTSVEIFANRGRIYMPIGVIPPDDDRTLEVYSKGGSATLASLEVHELKSSWE